MLCLFTSSLIITQIHFESKQIKSKLSTQKNEKVNLKDIKTRGNKLKQNFSIKSSCSFFIILF